MEEERWLEGVLEEMLEEYPEDGEDGEGEEDFVSLTFVGEGCEDSGFLEEGEESGIDLRGINDALKRIVEEPIAELASLTPLPPSPPRSPPIDLPPPSRRSSPPLHHSSFSDDASPPLHPPALTPDSTPPAHEGLAMLGRSVESEDDVDGEEQMEESFQWVFDGNSEEEDGTGWRSARGRGLLALDLSPPSKGQDVVALSLSNLTTSTSTVMEHSPIYHHAASPPERKSSSLALILSSAAAPPSLSNEQYGSRWTPRPPRSLSLPTSLRHLATVNEGEAPRGAVGGAGGVAWQGGIVKGFYDCVEYVSFPSLPLHEP